MCSDLVRSRFGLLASSGTSCWQIVAPAQDRFAALPLTDDHGDGPLGGEGWACLSSYAVCVGAEAMLGEAWLRAVCCTGVRGVVGRDIGRPFPSIGTAGSTIVASQPQAGPCVHLGMALLAPEVIDPTLFPPVLDHIEAFDGRFDTAQGSVQVEERHHQAGE